MRYREGQSPQQQQPDVLTDSVIDITVAYTLLVAILFIVMGRYGQQRWLVFWGVTTLLAVLAYGLINWLGLFQMHR